MRITCIVTLVLNRRIQPDYKRRGVCATRPLPINNGSPLSRVAHVPSFGMSAPLWS